MIAGLTVIPAWITPDEEARLLAVLGDGGTRKRTIDRNRIERFGPGVAVSGYTEATRTELAIAPHLQELADRLAALDHPAPDAVTVAWYLPGQRIKAHVDSAKAGPVISVLALASDATMVFRSVTQPSEYRAMLFEHRSLVVMEGEARWGWSHEILPVQAERVSIVFRRALPP